MRLIDADAFIAEMNERIEEAIKWGTNAIADRNTEIRIRAEQAVATFCEASLTAKMMTTIGVELVRHGHWLNHWVGLHNDYLVFMCDQCKCINNGRTKYCPCCGAKMEVEDETD